MKEDVWIKTTCSMCFSFCAIRVHRVDGVVVQIEGNPDSPTSQGGICPKGASGIMLLYDPNRLNVPMKRTNPQKGIGIDPKWEEITWDEALDTITERLRKLKEDDPRKLLINMSVFCTAEGRANLAFGAAFGSRNSYVSGAGIHCGNGAHLFAGLTQCAWTKQPDPNYVKYHLNFGCPSGFGAYYCVTGMAKRMADARIKGMKHVVIDPVLSLAAQKADEWIPVRPGTDAALALAMANLLLNEYSIYDAESLKRYTNGPYLVGDDGYYVRDKDTGKPMMWNVADGKARTYDDPSFKEVSLEGSYIIDGIKARTAFTIIREHVKNYTPEVASEITTVPARTIRRLAREYGEAASIGSTIVIDGKEMPYRPVSVGFFRGAVAHKHAALNGMALSLLQLLVGANDVPGGCLGANSRSFGYPETGYPGYSPLEGPDGLLQEEFSEVPPPPWPVRDAKKPELVNFEDFVPTGAHFPAFAWAITEPEKYGLPYKPEFMMQVGGNPLMSIADPKEMEKAFQELFVVDFNIYLDETAEFADIVLPDACYLERLDIRADRFSCISVVDEWAYHLRQPVVEPMFQRRPSQEVLLDIADRLGMLGKMYSMMNIFQDIKDPYKLDPAKKFTWEDIVNRGLKSYFGPAHGLDWFKENGLIHWPKKVEEVYWRPSIKGRAPLYLEYFQTVGKQVDKIKKENDIPGFDTADFQPVPDWKPCAAHNEQRSEFDLYSVYYRTPLHTCTYTTNNPWLDEVAQQDSCVYNVIINSETAKKKGIRNGDKIIIESAGTGYKAEGIASLTEGIHPEVIAYTGGGGHWAKRLPIASQANKGLCPEWLIPLSWEYIDTVSFNLELCVKVKVTKK